ncbi:hypothetical protein D9611_006251 [Ephemerocybe angulata]|uniref:PH domain-containing protein n=1 Tax=Ephemerocybe angulata TaxID=980116 RepID=A0A8H5C6B8_9AGAR|nr:hypothetical protein D9611_006251 [Tulosesus angulatus]
MHQTMLTLDNISGLTTEMVHKALTDPDFVASPVRAHAMGASFSTDPTSTRSRGQKPKPIALDMARRSFSETYAPHYPVPQQDAPPVPAIPAQYSPLKSSGMLGGLLGRRRKATKDEALPPPPPPKDDVYYPSMKRRSPQRASPRRSPPPFLENYGSATKFSPNHSMLEFGVVSSHAVHDLRTMTIEPRSPPPPPKKAMANFEFKTLPLTGKWAREASVSNPQEREARRREAQRQRELEEEQALEDERRRQEDIKKRKDEEKRREEEEEVERRLRLEGELRRIAAERERKRIADEEEERRRKREIEERKREDRERRLEEHRRLEQWRREREWAVQQEARKSEELRAREETERQRKIQQAEKLVVQARSKQPAVTTGWVTIQFNDSPFWKRRYYRFDKNHLHLYRSEKEKDTITPLETVDLQGKVKGLKEWKDGYEELEAIAYSFVVEFKDERGAWSMFSDSEADKFRFLGLMNHGAGL